VSNEAAALTYETMAEAAVQQAEYRSLQNGTMDPEGRGGKATWRRDRRLLRESNLYFLASAFCLDIAALVVKSQHPDVDAPVWVYILPIITLVTVGMAAYGCSRVWRLLCAARRAHGVQFRYTLLHSYLSGMPWLIFFEESAGDAAEPTGMVGLRYGPQRDYFRDLPTPLGKAVLAGIMRTGSTVVPRIDGFPLWPKGTFVAIDLDDAEQCKRISEMVRPE
jgi:hypothetical protein